MKQLFIPYEQALTLKELGFGEECLELYRNGSLELKKNTGGYYDNKWINKFNEPKVCSAPLYQQAFEWFRENFLISSEIKGLSFRATYVIGLVKEMNPNSNDGYPLVLKWDYLIPDGINVLTYEEAELACLIKLIEIIKNK